MEEITKTGTPVESLSAAVSGRRVHRIRNHSMVITQEELLCARGYKNQIRMLRDMADELEAGILQRLEAGGTTEPGALSARIKSRQRGGIRRTVLIVR